MRDFVRVDVSACLMGAFLLLTLPLNWLLSALAAAAFHELCHGAAILLLGGRIWGIRISAGGAVMETEPLSSGKELVCALAGPAGSLLLVLTFRIFPRVAVCALVQGAFNLLPVFPLDGGRALRCALARFCPKWANRIAVWAEWGIIGVLGALALAATFYWKLYQEICTNAVQNNCFVILEMISPSDEENENLPKMVSENKVDGVIVLGNMKKSYLERLEKTKVPVVFMDFYNMDICEDSVISNSFYGTYKITNYLFRKGHRDIAFVGNIHTTMSIMDRFLGYEKSLISHGIKLREDWIISDRESERVSYEDITLPEQMPTAFVCNCDQ